MFFNQKSFLIFVISFVLILADHAEVTNDGSSTIGASTFDSALYSQPEDIFNAYLVWHKQVTSSDKCKYEKIIVWTAVAGFGDSVNAFLGAFRLALKSSRILLIRWHQGDKHLFEIGVKNLGTDFILKSNSILLKNCGIEIQRLPNAYGSGVDASNRIAHLMGSISGNHYLIKYMNKALNMYELWLFNRVFQPPQEIELKLDTISTLLKSNVIGIHVRTGFADNPTPSLRQVEFISESDKIRFVNFAKHMAKKRKFDSFSLLVLSDDPSVVALFKSNFDDVISLDGPIVHSGPNKPFNFDGISRMLVEWYALGRFSTIVIKSAHSLFSSSALTGWSYQKSENDVFVLDHSLCHIPSSNRRPCASDSQPDASLQN